MSKSAQFMLLDKYSRNARLYPAMISLIPCFLLTLGLAQNELTKIIGDILAIKVVGYVSVNIALLFLLIQVNRFVAKEVFEKLYFEDELRMPTTNMLLPTGNLISPQLRNLIEQRCVKDFKLALPTAEEQQSDELMARRRIVEIVGLIRQKIKNGYLLLQHNIEYGFARNLIGSAPLALIISLADVAYFRSKSTALFASSIILAILWAALLLASKVLIKRFGILYAKRLIQEYSGGVKAA